MSMSYTSCACNRVPDAVDWGTNKLICYAACNAIIIYDPFNTNFGKVLQTLYQHKNRINRVQWIKKLNRKDPETEILSSSTDGTVIIWSRNTNEFQPNENIINIGKPVNVSNAIYITQNEVIKLLVCTGSVSGDCKLWLREIDQTWQCTQTVDFGNKLPIQANFFNLPNGKDLILAVALEDASIVLLTNEFPIAENITFVKVQVLIGHEDWIRSIEFCLVSNTSLLLASGSQDTTVRLWSISNDNDEEVSIKLKQEKQVFVANNTKYKIRLESVLSGHENWIYGINWHPPEFKEGEIQQPMKLLSCSLDKSMIIWEPDASTGIWSEIVRVGEVGGSSAGFYGCKFGPDGFDILAHGYQGSFHIWNYSKIKRDWVPRPVPGGHFAEVVDLCWEPKGRFLITASVDQTTRVHAPLIENDIELWHEIGRPQIHGYDMSCLTMITPYMFASGAEEKVIRIFTAPQIFKQYLEKLTDISDFDKFVVATSATVPALGLTNKATFEQDNVSNQCLVNHTTGCNYIPPTEEDLMQETLWPELQKLYGHGYEIFSMAANPDGTILATACKSSSAEHASIVLWDTKTWSIKEKLTSHQLTVTQLSFSPNGKYLLSVSRDRRWSLFCDNNNLFELVTVSPKKNTVHSRIIWCCTWSHDSELYATGSRDGKVGIWNVNVKDPNQVCPITYADHKSISVTALAFAPCLVTNSYVLAVGFETGIIKIDKLSFNGTQIIWNTLLTLDNSQAHHLTVKRLMFRPRDNYDNALQLASCGSDNFVKIYDLNVKNL